jgi:hypothetical protein
VVATATYDGRKRTVEATVVRDPGGDVSIRSWRRIAG